MSDTIQLILEALVWATFSTVVAQSLGFLLMWRLGLPPKKLIHEIEDVQNPAIGALFFIIALITSIFLAGVTVDFSPEEDPSLANDLAWIFGGLFLATAYSYVVFMIAHNMMGRIEGETVFTYIKRELITEQNVSLAFFFGGLTVAPFIAVLSQII
jgi:hypothetical protein